MHKMAPTFIASDSDLHGKPAVLFDGNDALGFAGSLGFDSAEGAQAFTVFIVATNSKSGLGSGFSFGDIFGGRRRASRSGPRRGHD